MIDLYKYRQIAVFFLIALVGLTSFEAPDWLGPTIAAAQESRGALETDEEGFVNRKATAKAKVVKTKKELHEKYDAYKAAEQKLADAERPKIGEAPPSPEVIARLRKDKQEAARRVSEATIAATEAKRRLRQTEELQAAQESALTETSPATAPIPNPLSQLDLKLGPVYRRAERLNEILEGFETLPLPEMVRPETSKDPFEEQLKKYQDMYEQTEVTGKPNDFKPDVPPVTGAPVEQEPSDMSVAGTTWRAANQTIIRFEPGGTFAVASCSGSWQQTDNVVNAECSLGRNSFRYKITIDNGRATMQLTTTTPWREHTISYDLIKISDGTRD